MYPVLHPNCTSRTVISLDTADEADIKPFIINNLEMVLYGAGRGNPTPMELPPTDFEFPMNAINL